MVLNKGLFINYKWRLILCSERTKKEKRAGVVTIQAHAHTSFWYISQLLKLLN